MTKPLSDEALGAALLALEDMDLHWWQRRIQRDTRLRSRIAHLTALRVEREVRRLVAEEPREPEPTAMAPYSGRHPGCAKCGLKPGALNAEARYGLYRAPGCEGREVEALLRRCGNCGYEWPESCADAPQPEPECAEPQNDPQGDTADSDGAASADGSNAPQCGAGDPHGALPADPRDPHSAAEGSPAVPAASETPETPAVAQRPAAGREDGSDA